MKKFADLHVHTSLSDGTFSPEKVVEYSKKMGLDAIAITDHDCVAGIGCALVAARDIGVEIVPGVELTAELGDGEIHILGYFIDWQDVSFIKKLDEITKVREERAKEILKKLNEHKLDVSEKELFDLSGVGSVGRLHIARLLLKKGFVPSIAQAFVRYLGDGKPCYVKKFKLTPAEAVGMIKGVGGVPVLAHPMTIYAGDKTVEDILGLLVKDGIQGIEVYHSDHKKRYEIKLKALAEKYNLAVTGGSDCHGFGKKEVLIGKVKIPYELVENLRKRR